MSVARLVTKMSQSPNGPYVDKGGPWSFPLRPADPRRGSYVPKRKPAPSPRGQLYGPGHPDSQHYA